MSVVAGFVYRNGKRDRPVQMAGAPAVLEPGEFVWIGLVDPTEAELRALQTQFGLHPLAVEDACTPHQLPKLDVYGSQLFLVTRTAQMENGQIVYGETSIFVGPGHILTVRHGSDRTHTALREHLEASPDLMRHGPDYVLHAALDFIVDGYQPVVAAVEEEALQMEERVLVGFLSRDDVVRIFRLRGELMRFRRILGPMEELAGRLGHAPLPGIDADVRPYFGDVLDHIRRISGQVDALREVVTWVFEASALLEQQQQGHITRKLAAWAGILGVPTAIAGIYGMNFEYMPELHWKYGYFVAVAGIAGVCLALYAHFKRLKWL
jgi:magnesium transporter